MGEPWASLSVVVLLLDSLELSAVCWSVSNQLPELWTTSKDSDTGAESKTSWASLEKNVLRKGVHAGSTHQRLNELGGWGETESCAGDAEECGEVDGVDASHGVELLFQ